MAVRTGRFYKKHQWEVFLILDNLFQGLFDSSTQTVISVTDFIICIGVSLLIGIFLAVAYTYKNRYTKSFVLTLAVIPAVVCVVIMMVNGNVGTGVAVAGAFGLVRFRSVPGTAREIGAIFLAMAAGLISGMGYLAYAVLFALILGAVMLLYQKLELGSGKKEPAARVLRITIPEDLDYTDVFDDLLDRYTQEHSVVSVKTTNMGSLFRLTYDITMREPEREKEFIDALRCRNGNLEISISRQEVNTYEL